MEKIYEKLNKIFERMSRPAYSTFYPAMMIVLAYLIADVTRKSHPALHDPLMALTITFAMIMLMRLEKSLERLEKLESLLKKAQDEVKAMIERGDDNQ